MCSDDMQINVNDPIYLTQAERYMLFRLAEHEQIPERTMLGYLIDREYSMLSILKKGMHDGEK